MISLIRTKICNNTNQRLVFAGILERPLVLFPKGSEGSVAIITGDIFSFAKRDIYCEPLFMSLGNNEISISYCILPGIETEVSHNDSVGGTVKIRDSYNKYIDNLKKEEPKKVEEVEPAKEVVLEEPKEEVIEEKPSTEPVEEVKEEPKEVVVEEEVKEEVKPVVETKEEVPTAVEEAKEEVKEAPVETEAKPKKARKIKVN